MNEDIFTNYLVVFLAESDPSSQTRTKLYDLFPGLAEVE